MTDVCQVHITNRHCKAEAHRRKKGRGVKANMVVVDVHYTHF